MVGFYSRCLKEHLMALKNEKLRNFGIRLLQNVGIGTVDKLFNLGVTEEYFGHEEEGLAVSLVNFGKMLGVKVYNLAVRNRTVNAPR